MHDIYWANKLSAERTNALSVVLAKERVKLEDLHLMLSLKKLKRRRRFMQYYKISHHTQQIMNPHFIFRY